jgi:hypothetical protein
MHNLHLTSQGYDQSRSAPFPTVGESAVGCQIPPVLQLHLHQPSFLSDSDNTIFKATMSFGFSVGDFLAVLQLAGRVRQRFVAAPEQFKGISNECVTLTVGLCMLIN